MRKFVLSITAIHLFVNSIYSQSQINKKDFNKDGVTDQVSITNDAGSAFSTKYITYQDGKTKKKYKFSALYSLGSFFAICNAPNILGQSGRELLGNQLFGSRDTVEPSLNWLIEACSNKINLKESGVVDFATKYTPIWMIGEPKLPKPYYSILSNTKYKRLLGVAIADGDFKSDYFWIDYNPYPHRSKPKIMNVETKEMMPLDKADFKVLKIDSTNWIYSTPHGVLLKKQDKYSWIFINDNQAFEANEKLRWPSIIDAQCFRNYVFVCQRIGTDGSNLFIINFNTGFVIRLSNDLMGLYSVDKIEVNKGNGNIELSDSGKGKYSLTNKAIDEIFKRIF